MPDENLTYTNPNLTTNETSINESIVPPVIQFLIGLVGNVAAIVILVLSSKEHKWRPFYRLVGGLVMTDLIGLIMVYPITLRRYTSNFTFDFPPALCGFVSFMLTFTFMSSASIVCAMSADRFLAILLPLTYSRLSKEIRINLTLSGIWLVTAMICSMNLIGLGSFKSFYPGSWCFINFASNHIRDRVNTYIYATIGLVILISTIVLNALVIFSVCRKFLFQKHQDTKNKKGDIFIIIYLVVVVILFTLCWTPLMVRLLINASSGNQENFPSDLLAVRLSTANVLIDPWIYIILRKKNFLIFARIWRGLKQRFSNGQKEQGSSLEDTNQRQDQSFDTDDTQATSDD